MSNVMDLYGPVDEALGRRIRKEKSNALLNIKRFLDKRAQATDWVVGQAFMSLYDMNLNMRTQTGADAFREICTHNLTLYEAAWRAGGCKTLFVESPQLIHALLQAKWEVEPEDIGVPFSTLGRMVAVSVPRGVTYEGVPIRPFLVGANIKVLDGLRLSFDLIRPYLLREVRRSTKSAFAAHMELYEKLYDEGGLKRYDETATNIVMSETVGRDRSGFYTRMSPEQLCTCVQSREAFEKKTAEDARVIQESPGFNDVSLNEIMDEHDRAASYVHTRLALFLWAYAQAHPDAVRYGLPRLRTLSASGNEVCERGYVARAYEDERSAVSMHLRAPHFRTLRHERYRRGVDGRPRVVAVRSAFVGAKKDAAYTESVVP